MKLPSVSEMPRGRPRTRTIPRLTGQMRSRQTRLEDVVIETQELLDHRYRIGDFFCEFRFSQGDTVICMSQGLYHEATLSTYFHSIIPDGPDAADIPVEEWTPSVIVHFAQTSSKCNEEMPENELISNSPTELCHIQGMLFAHEWNIFHRERLGLRMEDMGTSVWFFLDPFAHQTIDDLWKHATGKTISFAEYCGRVLGGNPVAQHIGAA